MYLKFRVGMGLESMILGVYDRSGSACRSDPDGWVERRGAVGLAFG